MSGGQQPHLLLGPSCLVCPRRLVPSRTMGRGAPSLDDKRCYDLQDVCRPTSTTSPPTTVVSDTTLLYHTLVADGVLPPRYAKGFKEAFGHHRASGSTCSTTPPQEDAARIDNVQHVKKSPLCAQQFVKYDVVWPGWHSVTKQCVQGTCKHDSPNRANGEP